MKVVSSIRSASLNGVHKHTPKCIPSKANQFAQWLKSVPSGVPKDITEPITIPINLELDSTYWLQLAQGASRNGWTLEECVMRLLVEGSPGLSEWSNEDFINADERAEETQRLAAERVKALSKAKKGHTP